jgi:hypothetical protein
MELFGRVDNTPLCLSVKRPNTDMLGIGFYSQNILEPTLIDNPALANPGLAKAKLAHVEYIASGA